MWTRDAGQVRVILGRRIRSRARCFMVKRGNGSMRGYGDTRKLTHDLVEAIMEDARIIDDGW